MSDDLELFKAINSGNTGEVYSILNSAKDIDINYFNILHKQSFLDAACQTKNPDIIYALINYAQSFVTPPGRDWYDTALNDAINFGNTVAVNSLIDSNQCTYRPAEWFNLAATLGNFEIIKILITKNLDYNATLSEQIYRPYAETIDEESYPLERYATPLYIACRKGNIEIVRYLLNQEHIDVNKGCPATSSSSNSSRPNFISPLMIAVLHNHEDIVSLLLAHNKIDIDQADTQGKCPFDIAIENKNDTIIDLLLTKLTNNLALSRKRPRAEPVIELVSSDNVLNMVRPFKKKRYSLFQLNHPNTPEQRFFEAIENGDLGDIKRFIKTYPNIITQCDIPPLHVALEEGHVDVVQLLINKGADINQVYNRYTLLFKACIRGNLQMLEIFLNNGANRPTDSSSSLFISQFNDITLWPAWKTGRVDIVNYLLQQKLVYVDMKTLVSSILLCPKLYQVDMLKMLKSHGAKLNISFPILQKHNHHANTFYAADELIAVREHTHTTLLIEACYEGEPELFNWLMSLEEIDVNLLDGIRHPLTVACYQGSTDIVEKLLACGSCENIRDALIIACDMGNIDVVDRLLNSKFDIHTRGIITGLTPFIVACKNGYLPIVDRLILVFGVNDELIKGDMTSIASGLMVAIMMGHMHIVDRLIESGANVNYANFNGESALMVAIGKKQPDAVQKLLHAKADIMFKNSDGLTALDLAKKYDSDGLLMALLEDALAKQKSLEAPRRSMS